MRSRSDDVSFRVGSVEVVVTALPIEKLETLQALVSSDDTMLSMEGGVSRDILRAAGQQVREEAARLVPLAIGDVAVTSAGRLDARYILHAVTVDWMNNILPTDRTLRHLSREVLRRCEALDIRTLGVAALATGAAGFAPEVAATLIVQGLAEHAQNPTVVELIVLSLPLPHVRSEFLYELETRTAGGIRALPLTSMRHQTQPRMHLERRPATADDAVSQVAPPFGASASALRLTPTPTTRPVAGRRYVLVEELGRGGMGVVFLAWDVVLRRTVAIKTLRQWAVARSGDRELLKKEASIAIGLAHESIVRIHHFEPDDPVAGPYLVMEYVDWNSGEQWIAEAGKQGLPAKAVVAVGRQLCGALAYAHGRQILHADIKPSNVFVDPSGERAKLADFGLSRVVASKDRSAVLIRLAGTPTYMAPEQKIVGAKITPATDVYLLATTLWEFLTGAPPNGPVATAVRPEAQELLDDLREALREDPARRPQTAEAFELVLVRRS